MDTEVATQAAVDTGAPADTGGALTAREAALLLQQRKDESEKTRAPESADAPARTNADDESDAGSDKDPQRTNTDADPDDSRPSIEPPRSWSREEKERFKTLPVETQQWLADQAKERETTFLKSQTEAAEAKKAAEAERQRLDKARTDYERALPALMQALQQQGAEEFSDIKSWDDVVKLAREDPLRYNEWNAHNQRLQAVRADAEKAQLRQMQEAQSSFQKYAQEQDSLILEKQPDMKDPKVRERVQKEAQEYLTSELGFTNEELARAWNGNGSISLRDARLQGVIRDALNWRNAQKAAKSARPANDAPPPARPGAAPPPRKEVDGARIRELDNRLDKSGKLQDAFELWQARKRAG